MPPARRRAVALAVGAVMLPLAAISTVAVLTLCLIPTGRNNAS
jgi:hypothetical protein